MRTRVLAAATGIARGVAVSTVNSLRPEDALGWEENRGIGETPCASGIWT